MAEDGNGIYLRLILNHTGIFSLEIEANTYPLFHHCFLLPFSFPFQSLTPGCWQCDAFFRDKNIFILPFDSVSRWIKSKHQEQAKWHQWILIDPLFRAIAIDSVQRINACRFNDRSESNREIYLIVWLILSLKFEQFGRKLVDWRAILVRWKNDKLFHVIVDNKLSQIINIC